MCQWLDWAAEQFGFKLLDKSNWQLSGVQICALSKEDFLERCPPGLGDTLHSHLCLLKAKGKLTACPELTFGRTIIHII